jgi:hypothetical protein
MDTIGMVVMDFPSGTVRETVSRTLEHPLRNNVRLDAALHSLRKSS